MAFEGQSLLHTPQPTQRLTSNTGCPLELTLNWGGGESGLDANFLLEKFFLNTPLNLDFLTTIPHSNLLMAKTKHWWIDEEVWPWFKWLWLFWLQEKNTELSHPSSGCFTGFVETEFSLFFYASFFAIQHIIWLIEDLRFVPWWKITNSKKQKEQKKLRLFFEPLKYPCCLFSILLENMCCPKSRNGSISICF